MLIPKSLTCVALCLVISGCGGGGSGTTGADAQPGDAESLGPAEAIAQSMAESGGEGEAPGGESEVPSADAGSIPLSPDNTQIQFIGTHAGDDPNPRTGEFTEFGGTANLDESGAITAVSVEIQTSSLSTEIENLTNHLQSPDFLDVREHPTITFETTSIEAADEGTTLTGNLTLMGTTNEVSFPAQVSLTDGQLSLNATLTINRTDYGMDGVLDRVNEEVEIKVSVGG